MTQLNATSQPPPLASPARVVVRWFARSLYGLSLTAILFVVIFIAWAFTFGGVTGELGAATATSSLLALPGGALLAWRTLRWRVFHIVMRILGYLLSATGAIGLWLTIRELKVIQGWEILGLGLLCGCLGLAFGVGLALLVAGLSGEVARKT